MGRRQAASASSQYHPPQLTDSPARTRRARASSVAVRGSRSSASSCFSHANQNGDVKTDNDDSTKTIHFPRRYPRLGAAFQLKKIPELSSSPTCSLLVRPAPFKLSVDAPHCTESEVLAAATVAAAVETAGDYSAQIDYSPTVVDDGDPKSMEEYNNKSSISSPTPAAADDEDCNRSTCSSRDSTTSTGRTNSTADEDDHPGLTMSQQDQPEQVRRGGLLVHSAENNDRYMLDNIQQSFYSTVTTTDEELRPAVRRAQHEAWAQDVVDWWRRRHAKTDECSGPRRTKSKYRRKNSNPPAVVQQSSLSPSTKEPAEEDEVQSLLLRPRTCSNAAITDQEEFILTYVQERHGGHVQQAVQGWQADWTGGRATSALRQKRKRQRERSGTAIDNSDGYGDNEGGGVDNDALPLLLGDFRKRKVLPAATPPKPAVVSRRHKRSRPSNDDLELHDAVLAIGKSLLRQCREDGPIVLSRIMTFVYHADQLHSLPLPAEKAAGSKEDEIESRRRTVANELGSCISSLRNHLQLGQKCKANLLDLWRKPGVDPEALAKQLEAVANDFDLEGLHVEMERQVRVVIEWQKRLDAALNNSINDCDLKERRDDLMVLEELGKEAKVHGIVSKGYLHLQGKLHKARQIRDRIQDWRQSKRLESIKFVAAIVRDLGRLKILFPEACDLLEFQREIEAWVDRANVAIRSRISLLELYALCEKQEGVQLDLSEYTDKLRMRAKIGQEWLDRFKDVVVTPGAESPLEWMRAIRKILADGGHSSLHELASEGSRIPVEVDCVKLLQVELDAKSWTAKVKKWLPAVEDNESSGGKKAKLEELEEHMEKATALRDRLSLSAKEKEQWILEGESELRSIVRGAEDWFDKYDDVLDGDNRRSSRARLSISKLRRIAGEADALYVNLASVGSKVTRILSQAEKWYLTFSSLLARCGLLEHASPDLATQGVSMSELEAAVAAAKSDLSIDLEEAIQLDLLTGRIRDWFNSATLARGLAKRHGGRFKKETFTVDRLAELLEEANAFPVNTTEECNSLRGLLEAVQGWQARASNELECILTGFIQLQVSINETYGDPSKFTRSRQATLNKGTGKEMQCEDPTDFSDEKKAAEDVSQCETNSSVGSEQDFIMLTNIGKGDCNVHLLIKNFHKEAQMSAIETPEKQIASELDSVWRWCTRSLKYLDSQRDIFDKRFFGAFDRFISEGRDFVKDKESLGPEVNSRLRSSWGTVVADQLQRLDIILEDRKRYVAWCSTVEQQVVCEGRKITIEKLRDICRSSQEFPPTCDMIKRVRDLEQKASSWIQLANECLSSGDKMSMSEVKILLEECPPVLSNELKLLRNGRKAARSWANRVKRCKPELGKAHVSDVKALLDEHESLIVEMPDEVDKLQHAVRNYCICCRPYDGFMIGCDTCDEWFHGPCVGVSESKAGRVDKYVCLRCSVSKLYKSSASMVIGVIRKWTSEKDRRKSRQLEAQKHQRKVRKEKKEIENLKQEQESLQGQLLDLENAVAINSGSVRSLQPGVPEACDAGLFTLEKDATEQEDISNVSGDSANPSGCVEISDCETSSKQSLQSRLDAIQNSLRNSECRLTRLAESASERRNAEELEDANSNSLKLFCMHVLSRILIPSSSEQAEISRPLKDGTMSKAMVDLIDEAAQVGLLGFKDVMEVANAFKCLSWSLRAMSVVFKQPRADNVESLLQQASELKLPDEKALRMMKAMVQRAKNWKLKVMKAIAPSPGEVKPYDLETLKHLADVGDDIPLCMPIESRLLTVIEDKGARHCLCGGPSDGRFMLSCDSCDHWYHGHCVGVSKEASDLLDEWKCPTCTGTAAICASSLCLDKFNDNFDAGLESKGEGSSISSDSEKAWPPYGLLDSSEALEALGEVSRALADDTDMHKALSTLSASTICVPPAATVESSSLMKPSSICALPKTTVESSNLTKTQVDVNMHEACSTVPASICAPPTTTVESGETSCKIAPDMPSSGSSSAKLEVGQPNTQHDAAGTANKQQLIPCTTVVSFATLDVSSTTSSQEAHTIGKNVVSCPVRNETHDRYPEQQDISGQPAEIISGTTVNTTAPNQPLQSQHNGGSLDDPQQEQLKYLPNSMETTVLVAPLPEKGFD